MTPLNKRNETMYEVYSFNIISNKRDKTFGFFDLKKDAVKALKDNLGATIRKYGYYKTNLKCDLVFCICRKQKNVFLGY